MSLEQKRMAIEPNHPLLSITAQCDLLDLSRSSFYYEAAPCDPLELDLMRRMDELHTKYPFLGSRRLAVMLSGQTGQPVNRKRIQRLMDVMGIEALHPRASTSNPHPEHVVYPYLLREVEIHEVNQVWSTDITYIPMASGWMYLVAVMDWRSRYILSWELSNSLDISFCLEALEAALRRGTPRVFNTDQGSQFTSPRFTQLLKDRDIQISMDGRGRALDNIWIERVWRSVKYEEVYLNSYQNGLEAAKRLAAYFQFYNEERPHQSLQYQTPGHIWRMSSPSHQPNFLIH
jgi:putative transposase